MKTSLIYEKYKIMPQLQTHMLRVAGVASVICDNFSKPIDKDFIVAASLIHDMGNIVKFDLHLYPDLLKPKGINYWEKIKRDFISKYGNNEHKATHKILKELKADEKISKIVRAFGFSKANNIYKTNNLDLKIAAYSDMRVAVYGVTTLEERLSEARKRYAKRITTSYSYKEFDHNVLLWKKVEEQIFYLAKIKPDEITDRKIMPQMLKLKNFDIKTYR